MELCWPNEEAARSRVWEGGLVAQSPRYLCHLPGLRSLAHRSADRQKAGMATSPRSAMHCVVFEVCQNISASMAGVVDLADLECGTRW